jgi:hypothetical protein
MSVEGFQTIGYLFDKRYLLNERPKFGTTDQHGVGLLDTYLQHTQGREGAQRERERVWREVLIQGG